MGWVTCRPVLDKSRVGWIVTWVILISKLRSQNLSFLIFKPFLVFEPPLIFKLLSFEISPNLLEPLLLEHFLYFSTC